MNPPIKKIAYTRVLKLIFLLILTPPAHPLFPEPICSGGAPRAAGSTTDTLPSSVKRQLDEAQKLMHQGEFDAALAAVQSALKLAPNNAEGLELLGLIYVQKQDYALAVTAFERALKADPRSAQMHNDLGNTYFAQKKLDLAEKEFQETLRYHPRDRDANYNLGLVLLAKNDPQHAIAHLSRVQPQDAAVLLNLAQAYFAVGEKAKALELGKSLSEQAKNDVRAHFTLGVLLAAQKQYGPAIHEFEMADALKPGTFEILHDLGRAYLASGENAKAEDVLSRALRIEPTSADTLYLLAQVYASQKKDVQALEQLVKARKLAPENVDVIFLMSRLSMKEFFFEDAIQLLEEGIRLAPQRADLRAALGESYFTAGKVDEAIRQFQTLIQLEPSARSYAFMGLCYRHLGRFDEARKYFNDGLKKDPRSTACLYNLGFIENRQGNYVTAEKLLEQALAVDPNYDDALYELAAVKMAQKQYAEAVPLLRRCVKLMPRPGEAYYKLATAERNLHQTDAAQRDLKVFETLSKDPSPGPYPFQHLFEYLDERAALTSQQKVEVDLEELRRQVEKHPDQPRDLYMLAEAYLKLGQPDEARKAVGELDRVSGGDARTALGVGVLLARYRLYSEAIQHFQTAIAADPASDDARYNLADAYFQTREYARALETLQKISPSSQNDDAVLGLVGDVDAHLGRTSEAITAFQKAVEKNPDNDQTCLSLALAQMQAAQLASAEQTLRRGLARAPDSGKLLWGLGVLSVLEGKNHEAEANFKKAAELLPDWQSSYSALGIFYYETGQIAQAAETLDQYRRLFPHGSLDVSRIQQALRQAESSNPKIEARLSLSAEARLQFLQMALTLAAQP